jgi:CBS domain-containing protein
MGMRQNPTLAEWLSSREVAVLPTDTLLRALGVMERYHIGLLPVVEQAGELVGWVTRSHILKTWRLGPLLPVALVMQRGGGPGPPLD